MRQRLLPLLILRRTMAYYRADGVRITHDPYARGMAEKYGAPGKTDADGFDPYADSVGPGIYGGTVKRDDMGQVVIGRQYQNHNPRPGPVYSGGGYTPTSKRLSDAAALEARRGDKEALLAAETADEKAKMLDELRRAQELLRAAIRAKWDPPAHEGTVRLEARVAELPHQKCAQLLTAAATRDAVTRASVEEALRRSVPSTAPWTWTCWPARRRASRGPTARRSASAPRASRSATPYCPNAARRPATRTRAQSAAATAR